MSNVSHRGAGGGPPAVTTSTLPADVTNSAASAGVSNEGARADHKHDITFAAPVAIGTANAAGSATTVALSDHVHDASAYAAKATANVFTKSNMVTPVALTDGASIALDASLSNTFTVTLGGNRTLANPTNVTAGMSWMVIVKQGAGSNTLAFGANYSFGNEGAPTLTTTAAKTDLIACYAITSTLIACTVLKNF